jgi:hypothetical protein
MSTINLYPTAWASVTGITNPTFAYNGNSADAATMQKLASTLQAPTVGYYTLQAWAAATQTYTALVLYTDISTTLVDGTYDNAYINIDVSVDSTNVTWTNMFSDYTAHTTTRITPVPTYTLSAAQNLTYVKVRFAVYGASNYTGGCARGDACCINLG